MNQHSEMEFLEELINSTSEGEKSKDFVYKLAEKHGLKPYQAENVWSFYKNDTTRVKVCKGLPCSLRAAKSDGNPLKKGSDEEIVEVSCLGYCEHAPVAWSNGKYYQMNGSNTKELDLEPVSSALGKIDSLDDYLAGGGFDALSKSMNNLKGKNMVDFVKEINLKGFGGSGFPTWVKWNAVVESSSEEKYLLVNAHEGEPGTFKDRILLENNPFELIEASMISALTVGADQIVIALKHEYIEAENALKAASESSLPYLREKLGKDRLPELKILRVPGYYITGEESALMEAIEGRRSEPRLRPPFPAEVGLFGHPTLIDNVETLLYFLGRLREHFGNGGKAVGEKSYCLTGDVQNPGSYRMPYGSPSTALLSEKGGTDINELKAILPGGLSGGILPAEKGDVKLDFDSVKGAGAGLGTGALIAVSKERCMVNVMESVESFFERESCGKCMPCRYGTAELSQLFKNLSEGKATKDELENAKKTADVMLSGSICGLGQASAKMFLDSIKYFTGEVEGHVSGKCQANVCFEGGR